MPSLNSRQRMHRAFNLEDVDHTPCAFMSFTALRKRFDEDSTVSPRRSWRWDWIAIYLYPACHASSAASTPSCAVCRAPSLLCTDPRAPRGGYALQRDRHPRR